MSGIWAILRAILFGWFLALVQLLGALASWLRRQLNQKDRDERKERAAETPCVPIQDPAFVRPDPMIYSQAFLAAHGLNYSWNNPDFGLFLNGSAVSAHELQPSTTYEVVLRIWNRSADGPVVATPVHLSYLSFGVGTVSTPIGTGQVDIGVKGSATNPAFLTIPWTTPAEVGHYCLQAKLDPVDDAEYGNNLGQHNTDVVLAASPAKFAFALRNDSQLDRTYKFSVDTYEIGNTQPCPGNAEARLEDPAALHRGDHPLPVGWAVDIAPPNPSLAGGAATSISVTITPLTGFVGSQVINVHAYYPEFDQDHLAGGVTVTVTAV